MKPLEFINKINNKKQNKIAQGNTSPVSAPQAATTPAAANSSLSKMSLPGKITRIITMCMQLPPEERQKIMQMMMQSK